MSRLTLKELNNCIRLLNTGMTQKEVADIYGVSQSVISRAHKRFSDSGIVNFRHGGGRVKKIGVRENRLLMRNVRRSRTQHARKLNEDLRAATGIVVSNMTIKRTLYEHNLRYVQQ